MIIINNSVQFSIRLLLLRRVLVFRPCLDDCMNDTIAKKYIKCFIKELCESSCFNSVIYYNSDIYELNMLFTIHNYYKY